MDFGRAEELFDKLSEIVDFPLFNNTPRLELCFTLSITSMQFAAAVRALCYQKLLLGASANLRSQFEALVRSVWALHSASDLQVTKLSAMLSHENQQAAKNIPSVNDMLAEIERVPQLANLMIAFKEFKDSSWVPLNSFVHAGIHAVHWTRREVPEPLLEQIFRMSNGLALLAFQGVGILTGRPGVQTEIMAATACYSSVLPKSR